jgi:hypothetical protein
MQPHTMHRCWIVAATAAMYAYEIRCDIVHTVWLPALAMISAGVFFNQMFLYYKSRSITTKTFQEI